MDCYIIPTEVLQAALAAATRFDRPVEATSHGLRILSEPKPTIDSNGNQLILSDGPAYHRDYLWRADYTAGTWTYPA